MNAFTGLTPHLCSAAYDIVAPAVLAAAKAGTINKCAGSVVVLNPAIPYEPKYQGAIDPQGMASDSFFDLVLWENPFGDIGRYDIDKYIAIARAKAFVSYLTGLPSHLVQQQFPSLYVPGMTKWGGSAVAGVGPMRLIVAFSGVQWHFDQMISEMVVSAIQAVCHEQMRTVMASDEAMILQPFPYQGRPNSRQDPI